MNHITDFRGAVMKRFIAIVATAAALVWFSTPAEAGGPPPDQKAASAGRASAKIGQKWSPWLLSPTGSGERSGLCTETVHYAATRDQVRRRTRLIAGGNTEIELKGALVLVLTPESQPDHHYTFDISGPSLGKHSQIQYANGDYLIRAVGPGLIYFTGDSVKGTGFPRLAYYARGSIADLYDQTNDKADIITRPGKVVDVCKYMGLDSAP